MAGASANCVSGRFVDRPWIDVDVKWLLALVLGSFATRRLRRVPSQADADELIGKLREDRTSRA
jgi:hypothetical protein